MTFALATYARLPLRFDIDASRSAVHALRENVWQAHFNTGYYEGDWSGVALRAYDNAFMPLAPGQGTTQPTAHCDSFCQLAR